MSENSNIILKIYGLTFFEGHGVGKSDNGKVYFVDQACPGDLLEVEVYKSKKNYSFAKIVKIIEPSQDRVKAPCEVFESCGGCSIQHVSYDLQAKEKQKVLQRYVDQKKFSIDLQPFEIAENRFQYRQRIEVHAENNKWGFYKKQSHTMVSPNECIVAIPQINKHLQSSKLSDGDFHVDIDGIRRRSRGSEGVFQQINSEINIKLKSYILDAIQPLASELQNIYDLYAGSGNYSLTFAEEFKSVKFYCVELSKRLIDIGREKSVSLPNLFWIKSDVEQFLTTKELRNPKSALVIVNPPRDGLTPAILKSIKQSRVKYITYVSCNPMTLFRDIDALSPRYKILSLKGFDMFPQTMHFETVAILESI